MHSESNYFPMIDTTDVYAPTRFIVRANRKCSVARNIGAIYSPKLYTHRQREKVQAQGECRRYVSYLEQMKRKSFKWKASHAHEHTHIHTRTHFKRNIGFHTSFRNETEKLSARKEFNRISR